MCIIGFNKLEKAEYYKKDDCQFVYVEKKLLYEFSDVKVQKLNIYDYPIATKGKSEFFLKKFTWKKTLHKKEVSIWLFSFITQTKSL